MPAVRYKPTTFRAQIAMMFGGVVLALIVVLSVVLGNLQANTIRDNAGSALQVVANNAQRVLALGLQRRLLIVESLAGSAELWEHGLDAPAVATALEQQRLVGVHLAWMGVADAAGIVRSSTGNLLRGVDVSARPWFVAGMRDIYVGDVHDALLLAKLLPKSSIGEPQRFVDFAAPIRVDGKTIGVLGLHGSWDWTRSVIESQLPDNAKSLTMDLLILDRAGTVIYAPTGVHSTGIKLRDSLVPITGQARQNASIMHWPDGHDYLTSIAPLQAGSAALDLGWLIVARMPKAVAYAPVFGAVMRVALIGGAAAVVAMLLAWFVAGSISKPLSAIERAAQDVLLGKEGATIPHFGNNAELHGLSNALIGMTETLERRLQEHSMLARFDPMTKLLNRRGFEERLEIAVANARRRESPLTVLAIDIDHFKRVNDERGHDAGDAVLIALAKLMMGWFRETDVVARMGGEEFTVLLVDTDVATAQKLAEKFVWLVSGQVFPHVGKLTISCGVAKLFGPDDGTQALKRADRALYRAKSGGRNRTALCTEIMGGATAEPAVSA